MIKTMFKIQPDGFHIYTYKYAYTHTRTQTLLHAHMHTFFPMGGENVRDKIKRKNLQ